MLIPDEQQSNHSLIEPLHCRRGEERSEEKINQNNIMSTFADPTRESHFQRIYNWAQNVL
jgi:hypothetical protein